MQEKVIALQPTGTRMWLQGFWSRAGMQWVGLLHPNPLFQPWCLGCDHEDQQQEAEAGIALCSMSWAWSIAGCPCRLSHGRTMCGVVGVWALIHSGGIPGGTSWAREVVPAQHNQFSPNLTRAGQSSEQWKVTERGLKKGQGRQGDF